MDRQELYGRNNEVLHRNRMIRFPRNGMKKVTKSSPKVSTGSFSDDFAALLGTSLVIRWSGRCSCSSQSVFESVIYDSTTLSRLNGPLRFKVKKGTLLSARFVVALRRNASCDLIQQTSHSFLKIVIMFPPIF